MKLACWVISLNPDAENTVKLLGSLQQQGISASLFPAVDGRRAMPALKNGERFNHVLAMIRHRKQLTSGELGCYLSHFRAVRKAYDEGYTHLCVLEDDVVIEPDFARVLTALLSNNNLDMVRFMALRLRPRKVIGDIADTGHLLTRPKRGAVGTQSYVLNRTGMKKFLDYAQTIYEPVDKLFDHFWLFNLKVYGVEPHTVYELDHATTIAKRADPSAMGPTLWMRLAYHPVKLWFSVRRHFHLLRHRDEYTPAVKSGKSKAELGRTSRIR